MTEREWLESDDPAAMLEWYTGRVGDGSRDLGSDISPRKLRLWACAMLRGVQAKLVGEAVSNIAWAEEWADGRFGADSWSVSVLWPVQLRHDGRVLDLDPQMTVELCCTLAGPGRRSEAAALLRDIVGNPFQPVARHRLYRTGDPDAPSEIKDCNGEVVLGLCRDCGKAEVELSFPCRWLTPTVTRLALAAYQERNPDGTLDADRLAVLSDALEEAGCPQRVVCHGCDGTGGFQANSTWVPCELCDGDDPSGWGSLPHPTLAALRSPGPHYWGFWALDLLLGRS